MANEINVGAQRIASSAVKSVKVETALFEPIVMTGDELFADTSEGAAQADWVLSLVKPAVTIELSSSMRTLGAPGEIVIAPAGVPTSHSGWMPLAIGAALGAAGLFALGFWAGRRQSR